MNTLFVRTFLAFTAALLILVAIISCIFSLGFNRSLQIWNEDKQRGLLSIARDVLTGEAAQTEVFVDQNTPFFVYDASKQLVYSNRGAGRWRTEEGGELTPVTQGSRTLGYYFGGETHFQDDSANRRLLESMYRVIWISLASSLGISLVFAFFFSKGLSTPARRVATGIDAISAGDFTVKIPERGAREISSIAQSANRLSEQLAREQELRNQWAQDVTHDLRTPISVLRAQFEGMLDGVLDVTADRIQKNIQEIDRIQRLVVDLEELMRLESPEVRLSLSDVKARQFLEEIKDRYFFEAQKKGARIKVVSNGVELMADKELLARAVINCVANAVRHVHAGGRIVLGAHSVAEGTSLTVSNTGDEIPLDEREHIFDRLYRGDSARTSPGSGLGLTIAKRIVKLHGGSIKATAYRGPQGTTGVTIEMIIPSRGSQSHFC